MQIAQRQWVPLYESAAMLYRVSQKTYTKLIKRNLKLITWIRGAEGKGEQRKLQR